MIAPTLLRKVLLTGCLMWLLGGALAASANPCLAAHRHSWTADEGRVWDALCNGEKLDFGRRKGIITGAFLREILSTPLSTAWNGRLEVSRVIVKGKTNWSGLEVDHTLQILDSTFKNEIDGSDAVFKGSVCLQGSDLLGAVNFARSQIDGGLYLGDEKGEHRCSAEPPNLIGGTPGKRRIEKLTLDSLTAKGDIYVRNFVTDNVISAEQVESRRNVFFWYCSAAGINLPGARSGQQINIVDCSVRSWSENGGEFAIQLDFAQAKEGVFLTRSKVLGPVLMEYINCPYLNFRGAQLQSIDLQEAVISAALDFGWVIDPGKSPAITSWEPYNDSWMNLHDAKIGSIVVAMPRDAVDIKRVWPESIGSLGMAYERFYGVSVDLNETGRIPIPTDLSSNAYIDFLKRQQPFSETGYRFLGNWLVNSGEDTKGKKVLYAGRVATRRQNLRNARWFALTAYADWFGSFMIALTIGYGYYMYRVVYWILLLIAVGAVVFHTSTEARENRMPFGIAYSFDMLIPGIELRKLHSEIVLKGWQRYYFYIHKISGYVFAAFVAAGLSGITK